MTAYRAYATSKDTPSRKQRKSQRNVVFQFNRRAAKLAKRPRGTAQAVR